MLESQINSLSHKSIVSKSSLVPRHPDLFNVPGDEASLDLRS